MSEYLTPEALTTDRVGDLPEEDVEVAGGKVRVRGLTRGEVLAMRTLKEKGILNTEAKWEAHLIHKALIQPVMTEEQVGEWQRRSPAGEMNPVSDKVSELSGLSEGAEKSGVSEVPEES